MGKKLYVGNLSYDTNEESLRTAFATDGRAVERVQVMLDRETGRPRGFAFVEFGSDEDAQAALAALDGTDLDGRTLRVSEAQERPPRGAGGPRRSGPPPREHGATRDWDSGASPERGAPPRKGQGFHGRAPGPDQRSRGPKGNDAGRGRSTGRPKRDDRGGSRDRDEW